MRVKSLEALGCTHGRCVSGQAGVTQVTAGMTSFWMEKGKKKETKPAEGQ